MRAGTGTEGRRDRSKSRTTTRTPARGRSEKRADPGAAGEGPAAGGAKYGVRNRNKEADTEAFRRGTERPGSGKTEGWEARFIGNLI